MRAFASLIFCFAMGCSDDNPTPNDLLTSTTWGKPELVHQPSAGFTETKSCAVESTTYNFNSDGSYRYFDVCNSTNFQMDGKWSWTQSGKEIKLETIYNDVPQKTYRILILELSNQLLHTKQMEYSEPLNTAQYVELKYRPK